LQKSVEELASRQVSARVCRLRDKYNTAISVFYLFTARVIKIIIKIEFFMFNIFRKHFKEFLNSESGNVLIIVAFVAILLVTAVGVAVDTARIELVKLNQQHAVDAAERSANNFCKDDTTARTDTSTMRACITEQVNKYYQANLITDYMGAYSGNTTYPTVSFPNGDVSIKANTKLDTVLVRQTVKRGGFDPEHKDDLISKTITVKINTEASNVVWNAVCGEYKKISKINSCVVGTYSFTSDAAFPDYTHRWDCVGKNLGTNDNCEAIQGNCAVPTDKISGACKSGTPNNFQIITDSTKYYTTWTCDGTNGGESPNCKKTFCTAKTIHTDCPTGQIGNGIDKNCTCDSSGNFTCSTVKDCTALQKCKPYEIVDLTPCPANTTGTPTKSTTYYVCDPVDPYKPAFLALTNPNDPSLPNPTIIQGVCKPDPATCVPGSENTLCGSGFSNPNEVKSSRTSTCPDPYGTPVWGSWKDTGKCIPLPTCKPYDETRTIPCGGNQYGNKKQIQHYTCPDPNGTPVGQGWIDSDTSQCHNCQTMVIDFWVRTRLGLSGFSKDAINPNQDVGYIVWDAVDCTDGTQHYRDYLNPIDYSSFSLPQCANSGNGASGWINNDSSLKYLYESTDTIITKYRSVNSSNAAITQCPASFFRIMEHNVISPLKVNLNGGDAKLNSDRPMTFSMNNNGTKSTVTTSGSLNDNEAWLMVDRLGDGLVQNGIIDGNDFFSDHNGSSENGYKDLAATFGGFIKKDEKGNNYIELHKLSDAEKKQFMEQSNARKDKRLGAEMQVNPSFDLRLLNSNNQELYASEYFDRIYVDYIKTSKTDKEHKNYILQKALVRNVNGKYRFSADQWFEPSEIK